MRGIGYHTPPNIMQPKPKDNTFEYVHAQIKYWFEYGTPINYESAREIAAWWQAPNQQGLPFSQFAGEGTISIDLGDSIRRELNEWLYNPDLVNDSEMLHTVRGLIALQEYVTLAFTQEQWAK